MSQKCDKCQSDTKGGAIYTEWGKVYNLCKPCSIIVDCEPTGGRLQAFMDGFDHSDETRSMIEARKRRAQGIRLWT